jgi:FKBP-type peptidyl-prolyl cis-trans isomerase FkpA
MNSLKYINITYISLLLLFPGILLISCSTVSDRETINEAHLTEALETANVAMLEIEKQNIDDFIDRYGWVMEETGSGLHYHIYEYGDGPPAETGKTAVIQYNLYLLNGELIYSSENEGIKQFMIGQGGVESGLEEAILLLNEGDSARFIIPAHLAHGVPGDGFKIPRQAAILYELNLLKLL